MKKFRFLLALVVVVATLCTVAMAAEGTTSASVLSFEVAELEYNAEGIDVAIKTNTALTGTVDTVAFGIKHDTGLWTLNDITYATGIAGQMSTVDINGVTYASLVIELPSPVASIDADTTIVSFKAVPASDAVIGKTFDVVGTYVSWNGANDYWYADAVETDISATVVAAEEEEEIIPSTASITSEMKTIVTEKATYSNVWVGAIKVALGNDGVTGVYAKYNNGKTTKTYDVDGDGEVKATVAIVGAPADAVVEAILVK